MTAEINSSIRNVNLVNGSQLYDWEITGEDAPTPVFYAINNSPEVHIGTGDLTTVWASGGYVWNGSVYEAVAPNTPIWQDGWLQYYPEATNGILYFDPSTASECRTSDGITFQAAPWLGVFQNKSIVPSTFAGNISLYGYTDELGVIGESDVVVFYVEVLDGLGAPIIGTSSTGDFRVVLHGLGVTPADTEVIQVSSTVYKVLGYAVAGSTNRNFGLIKYPTQSTRTFNVSGLHRFHDKTIAECRDLPPVFTEGSAVTMDRTAFSFDIANHDNAQGAWYCEFNIDRGEVAGDIVSGAVIGFSDSSRLGPMYWNTASYAVIGYDGTSAVTLGTPSEGDNTKSALAYSTPESMMEGNMDNIVGSETAYDGAFDNLVEITPFSLVAYPAKMRNLRRYDTDYSVSKQIIEVLMK